MQIPNDYAQANLKFTGTAAPTGAEITLGLNVELFSGSPADAADAIANAWDGFPAVQTDSISMTSILVKFGPNSTGPSAEVPFNMPGTLSSGGEPPQIAAVVRKVTGFGGRTGRGRFFLPGLDENNVNPSGLLDPAYAANIQTAADGFHADLVAAALIPTLLHSVGSPISTPMPITSFQVDARTGTQRRRNRR